MSRDLKNIKDEIMEKIHEDKLKMRPKVYFIIGSVLAFVGLAFSVIFSIFLVGLLRFSLRAHGPMADYRFQQFLSNFPWWIPLLAIMGLILGILLIRRYDFSYKFNFKVVSITLVLLVIFSGFVIDLLGFSDIWFRTGPMNKPMRKYLQEKNIRYGEQVNFNYSVTKF